jgi:hypothetical protein
MRRKGHRNKGKKETMEDRTKGRDGDKETQTKV